MKPPLHTVVETPPYLASARRVGLSERDMNAVLDQLMSDPSGGDLIRESGGIRKVRIGKADGGKSGGYRVLTYFMDADAPVFLLLVFDKTEDANISAEQTKRLKVAAKAIKDERNQGW